MQEEEGHDPAGKRLVIDVVRDRFRAWPGSVAVEAATRAITDVDVFLAGGAVRDALGPRDASPKDFDLFVGGPRSPEFVAHLAGFGEVSHGPFGSPRWFPASGGPYADVILIDHFNNGVEKCRDITDVLRQFDFTANAVAVDLNTGTFYNPCGGLEDFRQGVLRAVRLDYPNEPIANGLRLTRMAVLWMRLMHYGATLKLKPDEETQKWLAANAGYARHRDIFAKTFFAPNLSLQALVCT